ncbi:MAG: serine/threonine protein kinase [Deltaproteobacteria bacterium]|nr:serine/threonine protein kinase [Deltaproteobacteria bacterium]
MSRQETGKELRLCPACAGESEARFCPRDGLPTVRKGFFAGSGDLLEGQAFGGRYRIQHLLGKGGMGRVYQAVQLGTEQLVALKTLPAEHVSDRVRFLRFCQEARLACSLSSPHVVRVFEFGLDDDTQLPFLVMELLRGKTLRQWLAPGQPLGMEMARRVLLQVAEALLDAEKAGVVHRDLKPENVFLVDSVAAGVHVKVTDFGIAKAVRAESETETGEISGLTQAGQALGTPQYMAPEQVLGQAVDHRSDLFALGCVLYEMLTGRPRLLGGEATVVMMRQVSELSPALPERLVDGTPVPKPIRTLHRRLLAKNPDQRPGSAEEVIRVIQGLEPSVLAPREPGSAAALDDSSTLMPARSVAVGDASPSRRRSWWWAGAIVAIVALSIWLTGHSKSVPMHVGQYSDASLPLVAPPVMPSDAGTVTEVLPPPDAGRAPLPERRRPPRASPRTKEEPERAIPLF